MVRKRSTGNKPKKQKKNPLSVKVNKPKPKRKVSTRKKGRKLSKEKKQMIASQVESMNVDNQTTVNEESAHSSDPVPMDKSDDDEGDDDDDDDCEVKYYSAEDNAVSKQDGRNEENNQYEDPHTSSDESITFHLAPGDFLIPPKQSADIQFYSQEKDKLLHKEEKDKNKVHHNHNNNSDSSDSSSNTSDVLEEKTDFMDTEEINQTIINESLEDINGNDDLSLPQANNEDKVVVEMNKEQETSNNNGIENEADNLNGRNSDSNDTVLIKNPFAKTKKKKKKKVRKGNLLKKLQPQQEKKKAKSSDRNGAVSSNETKVSNKNGETNFVTLQDQNTEIISNNDDDSNIDKATNNTHVAKPNPEEQQQCMEDVQDDIELYHAPKEKRRLKKKRKNITLLGINVTKKMKRKKPIIKCELTSSSKKTKKNPETSKQADCDIPKSPLLVCNVCQRVFKSQGNLTNHLKVHVKPEGPFECDICFNQYIHRNNLSRHKKVHCKELNVPEFECFCFVCVEGFPTIISLTRHVKEVHPELA